MSGKAAGAVEPGAVPRPRRVPGSPESPDRKTGTHFCGKRSRQAVADPQPIAGASQADSPADIPPRGWKQILVATWKDAGEDNLGLVSAGVAFYAFLAFVPLLSAFVLSYGLIAEP